MLYSFQKVNHRKPPRQRTSTQPTSRDECNDESTSLTDHLEHRAPAYVGQPNTSTPHTKTHSDDYTYSINESPKSVKLKCIMMQDGVTSLKKRLKTSETKSRRLRRKVESLQTVVKILKEKHMLSDQVIEMLEKTCDVPSELMKRLVKARHTALHF